MIIRFTHVFELAHKVVTIVGALVLVAAITNLISPLSDFVEAFIKSKYLGVDLWWVWMILALGYFFFCYVGSIILLDKTVLPHWLSTYLYVRLITFTKISLSEARRVSFLFDGSLNGTWYPLSSLRKLDSEFRREALFRFANKIAAEYKWRQPFDMPEDAAHTEKSHQRTSPSSGQSQQSNASQSVSSTNVQLLYCLKVLGLNELPESFEPIRNAYRRKIRQFHPDKFFGEKTEVLQYAEEMSKKINLAYTYLQDYCEGDIV